MHTCIWNLHAAAVKMGIQCSHVGVLAPEKQLDINTFVLAFRNLRRFLILNMYMLYLLLKSMYLF